MTTEEQLYLALYALAGLVIFIFLRKVWQNLRARRGLDQQILVLEVWAAKQHWPVVDRKVIAPWRKPYEDTSGTVSLIPKAVALGKLGDVSGMVAVGRAYDGDVADDVNPDLEANVTYWRFPITPVGGWLRLRSTSSRFKGQIKETNLESIEFNDRVQVHAYPKKIAHHLLPPDFMDWYLRTSAQPWIHVNDGVMLVVYELNGKWPKLEDQKAEVEKILATISAQKADVSSARL